MLLIFDWWYFLTGFIVLENVGLISKLFFLSKTFEFGVYSKEWTPVCCIIYLDSSFIFFISSLCFEFELIIAAPPVIGLLANPYLDELIDPSLSLVGVAQFSTLLAFYNPDPIDLLKLYIGDLFYKAIYPAKANPLLLELSLFCFKLLAKL